MPRIAPLYHFIKMHYLETRKMGFKLSVDVARQEALKLWDSMTQTDRDRVKRRVLYYDLEDVPIEAQQYYEEIRNSDDSLLQLIYEEGVRSQAHEMLSVTATPIFFLHVENSRVHLGYPEELSIVRWSLHMGVEGFFHALFSIQDLGEEKLKTIMASMKSKLYVNPIRDHKRERENMELLADLIRQFTGGRKLFTPRARLRAGHAVMQLINRVDEKFVHQENEVFDAESLLNECLMRTAPENEIVEAFWNMDRFNKGYLACDFHQAMAGRRDCTLLEGLLLAQNFGTIFSRMEKRGRMVPFTLFDRPPGMVFAGSSGYVDPVTLCESKFDGEFRIPCAK